MKFVVATILILALVGQSLAQTLKTCVSNSDCTNFDGQNVASCCYTLTGVGIVSGQSSTGKYCDYVGNPGHPKFATAQGFKSLSGSCSSSATYITAVTFFVMALSSMILSL